MNTYGDTERARREGTIFGIPMGDLGPLASLLMVLAFGMTVFFLGTFLAICALLIYVTARGLPMSAVDFAATYKIVGFPLGMAAGAAALVYLGIQYARRRSSKREI